MHSWTSPKILTSKNKATTKLLKHVLIETRQTMNKVFKFETKVYDTKICGLTTLGSYLDMEVEQ